MHDEELVARMRDGMAATLRLSAQGSPSTRLLEHDGVVALITPETPDRSVLNSVVYTDFDGLRHMLAELAEAYERAGVRAWAVWVPDRDKEARRLLEGAGHRIDTTLTAMGRELVEGCVSLPHGAEWTYGGDLAILTGLNDAAYGWDEDRPWTRALKGLPTERVHVYTSELHGKPAAGLLAHDQSGNCTIWLVATLKRARRLGLATGLLGQALVDACERGCSTSTLQATKLGEPVYLRLGYRPLGRLEMWERKSGRRARLSTRPSMAQSSLGRNG